MWRHPLFRTHWTDNYLNPFRQQRDITGNLDSTDEERQQYIDWVTQGEFPPTQIRWARVMKDPSLQEQAHEFYLTFSSMKEYLSKAGEGPGYVNMTEKQYGKLEQLARKIKTDILPNIEQNRSFEEYSRKNP